MTGDDYKKGRQKIERKFLPFDREGEGGSFRLAPALSKLQLQVG